MKKLLPFSFFLLCISVSLHASHILSGDIRYERIEPFTEFRYKFTVTKYMNSGPSSADRCVDTVYFGDGNKGVAGRINGDLCDLCSNVYRCGEIVEPGMSVSVFTVAHTYAAPGAYTIASVDLYRSFSYMNIYSTGHPFYITAYLRIGTDLINERSAGIYYNPVLVAGTSCFSHTPVVEETEGDSLAYEAVACLGANGQPISGYFFPDVGPGGIFEFQGSTLVWCSPQTQGRYAISFLVKEYRRDANNQMQLIGWVQRDQDAIVYGPVSVRELAAPGVPRIFPQPVNETLSVERNGTGKTELSLFDIRGRVMMEKVSRDEKLIDIDLKELEPGIYILRVVEEGRSTCHRVIKQ
jgi:hypothetical protein